MPSCGWKIASLSGTARSAGPRLMVYLATETQSLHIGVPDTMMLHDAGLQLLSATRLLNLDRPVHNCSHGCLIHSHALHGLANQAVLYGPQCSTSSTCCRCACMRSN